jgi:hypothetical protein
MPAWTLVHAGFCLEREPRTKQERPHKNDHSTTDYGTTGPGYAEEDRGCKRQNADSMKAKTAFESAKADDRQQRERREIPTTDDTDDTNKTKETTGRQDYRLQDPRLRSMGRFS